MREEGEEEEEEWGGGGGGGKCHKKSGSGCSTLAAHHGSSQVNVKTRESFAEYWFNAAARAGGRCALQITCALFPTHTEPWVPLPPHSREPERDRERMFFYVLLPSVTSNCVENLLGTTKQATTALICKTYQAPFVSIRVRGNTKGSPHRNLPPPMDGIPSFQLAPRPLNNELASELVSIKKDGRKGWFRSHVYYRQSGRKKYRDGMMSHHHYWRCFFVIRGDFIPFWVFFCFFVFFFCTSGSFFSHPRHMEITQPRSLLWSRDDCLVKSNRCIGSLSSKLSRRDNVTIKLYGMSHKLEDLILRFGRASTMAVLHHIQIRCKNARVCVCVLRSIHNLILKYIIVVWLM